MDMYFLFPVSLFFTVKLGWISFGWACYKVIQVITIEINQELYIRVFSYIVMNNCLATIFSGNLD